VLPRIFRVPGEGLRTYVFLADTIRWQLPELFAGATILDHTAFRVTRNSNLYVDEEEVENLLTAIEQELRRRRRGDPVRLEVRAPIGDRLRQELLEVFELGPEEVFECQGPVNLSRLMQLVELEKDDRLSAPTFVAAVHPALRDPAKLFPAIRSGDVLLHHPFDSFDSVVEFLEQAAEDPRVLAIKQTLYRTSEDSPIGRALLAAAERGKHVTALVELKARFDEEKNIRWARRMEEAGVQIVYGLVGLKTHCKLMLVVRRDEDGLRRYAHIGTGNYHAATARLYEDFGIFTADEDIAADVADLFNFITGFGRPRRFRKLLVAPFTLRSGLVDEIRAVAAAAAAGERARIRLKVNHLVDPGIVEELYSASQAGARIDVVARTTCALRPEVEGLSENIRVRSLVGRFLEHSRIYAFEAGDRTTTYIGSPDLMQRNLDHRIEVLVPVENARLRQEVHTILDSALADDSNAWLLGPDGTWTRATPGDKPHSHHAAMARRARARARRRARPRRVE
jgi:polyphosphate kinase